MVSSHSRAVEEHKKKQKEFPGYRIAQICEAYIAGTINGLDMVERMDAVTLEDYDEMDFSLPSIYDPRLFDLVLW
jgi:hypothetical protein